MTTQFRGTQSDGIALTAAVQRFCVCRFDNTTGARSQACIPHQSLLNDQRWLDGLLFERWRLSKSHPGAAQRVIPTTPTPLTE